MSLLRPSHKVGPGVVELNLMFHFESDVGQCVEVTHNHANLEGWTYSYANTWDYLQAAYPSIAPVNLGNSGYYGSVTMYVASTISSNSYANEGLALSYYRNYNVSWHTPWTYSTGLEAVDRKHLAPCNQTRFYSSSEDMKLYRELTNDADGVAQLPDGTWHAVCPDGFFWLPPGCRSNTSHCIPFFTGGTGWNIEARMMWCSNARIRMHTHVQPHKQKDQTQKHKRKRKHKHTLHTHHTGTSTHTFI